MGRVSVLSVLGTDFLSCSVHLLRLVCSDQGLVKGLVDVEVFPLFRRGLAGALETTCLALSCQRFKGDNLIGVDNISHVALREDEHDRL